MSNNNNAPRRNKSQSRQKVKFVQSKRSKSQSTRVAQQPKKNNRNQSVGFVPRATMPVSRGFTNRSTTINRSFTVSHRELMIPTLSRNFQSVFQLSPTNSFIFPWLSQIGGAYEKYVINSITFEYQPSCSTLTNGLIYMAFDHDPSDAATNNFLPQTLTQMQGCVSGSLYSRQTLSPKIQKKQFLTGAIRTGASINDYVPGIVYVVASNSDQSELGQIYVRYNITFFTPQPQDVYMQTLAQESYIQNSTALSPNPVRIPQSSETIPNTLGTLTTIGSNVQNLTFNGAWKGMLEIIEVFASTPSQNGGLTGPAGMVQQFQNAVYGNRSTTTALITALAGYVLSIPASANASLVKDLVFTLTPLI